MQAIPFQNVLIEANLLKSLAKLSVKTQRRYSVCQKKQVAQLSQRDRTAGWVSNGQKWKTGTERQYLRTI